MSYLFINRKNDMNFDVRAAVFGGNFAVSFLYQCVAILDFDILSYTMLCLRERQLQSNKYLGDLTLHDRDVGIVEMQ